MIDNGVKVDLKHAIEVVPMGCTVLSGTSNVRLLYWGSHIRWSLMIGRI